MGWLSALLGGIGTIVGGPAGGAIGAGIGGLGDSAMAGDKEADAKQAALKAAEQRRQLEARQQGLTGGAMSVAHPLMQQPEPVKKTGQEALPPAVRLGAKSPYQTAKEKAMEQARGRVL